MTGQQFNTLIGIMSVGYMPMQIPSNVLLSELRRPSIYLSCCTFLWGIFSICIGASTSYHAALLSRFSLGFVEAAYYPGALFILSRWYKRHEIGLRMVYFTCAVAVSRVIGPLIASGIFATMDGVLGFAAWRWLFFIEGALTSVVVAIPLDLIPDFPTTPASWLTTEEQILAQERMMEDVCGVEDNPVKNTRRSGLTEASTDWTVWWLALTTTFMNIMLSFQSFFPTLVATIGYGPIVSLLLCSPPWIIGVATSIWVMRHSDVTGERFWHATGPILMAVMGSVIAVLSTKTGIRYLALYFMAQSPVSFVITMAWLSNSISDSSSKRAVAIAFVNSFSCLGDIGGSYLWIASWGPSYSKSYVICILAAVITTTMLWVYRSHLVRLNKAARIPL